jgi:hypothetical protein
MAVYSHFLDSSSLPTSIAKGAALAKKLQILTQAALGFKKQGVKTVMTGTNVPIIEGGLGRLESNKRIRRYWTASF